MRLRVPADRWWIIVGLLAAAAVTIGLAGPWGLRMIDLEVYRIGADALLRGTDIYSVAEPSTGLVFTYPVFAAILFVPFAVLPVLAGRVVLTVLSLAALFVIVYLTVGHVGSGHVSSNHDRGDRPVRTAVAWAVPLSVLAVGLHPVWETLTFAQVNLILTALVLVDVLSHRTGRWRGVLVGIAAGIKIVPGLFILYFLVTGQRRAALTSALATLGTIAAGFAVQPGPSWDFWTHHAFTPSRTGQVAYVTNQSLVGVAARLLRDPDPPRLLGITLGIAALVVALLLARAWYRRGDVLLAVSVTGVGALLASPVSWSHHWVWAIPALGTLAAWAMSTRPAAAWRWWLFGLAAAIVAVGPMQFTPKGHLRELQHTVPQQLAANVYAGLAIAYLVWAIVRSRQPAVSRLTASGPSAPRT